MTRSVADTESEALSGLDLMVQDYVSEGYERVAWDDSAWPPVPDELFDPDMEQ